MWARRLIEQRLLLSAIAAALLLAVTVAGTAPAWALGLFLALALVIALVPTAATPSPNRRSAQRSLVDQPSQDALISAIGSPLILVSADLTVIACNQAARELRPALSVGEPLSATIRVPEVIDAVRSVIAASGTRHVDYTERVPIDRAFEASIAAIPNEAGKTAYVVILLHDVTQARRVEQMRVDFVANASHELRTPLASLLGFIETLQGPARNDPAARERFLAIMRAQAGRMARLIDDLLSLSRIEMKAHLRPDSPVDLGQALAHVVDTFAPTAKERDIDLTLATEAAEVMVLGERDELIRVFENLIENAIKYGAEGGRIEVSLAIEPEGRRENAVIRVRDFGAGIPSEHVPRLTERFYRVDATQSREKGGTGLGLAIVKHIVARHRGRLAIESRVDHGSIFSVRLERHQPAAPQARSAPVRQDENSIQHIDIAAQ